ncbi:alpha/beta hydrolase [Caulobacter sp. S45]|uniref:alpha/beta hydrolase n=1 Tax=Caulobacter sp. S45 TaxID=1641861 RepID=UPI0020B11506|nr:alpha/beta hydrolase-fold protein [Caulobacter sp. S45]
MRGKSGTGAWTLGVAAASLLALSAALAACSRPAPVKPGGAGQTSPTPVQTPPYVLEDTEVRTLHAGALGRDYRLLVSLPPSYGQRPGHRFPVIFVTDADYGFPLLRSITRRVGDHGVGMEEAVIVGLAYAQGDTPEYSRRRDYTPTASADTHLVSDMAGRPPRFGEAEGYRRFIAGTVFPFIARSYRVDMGRKIYVGHSYGALLGVDILLSDPAMFQHYLISSPSLWYGHRVMFAREQAYAGSHKDMDADVYMAVGGYETIRPGSSDLRYGKGVDMAADEQAFASDLASRHYPNLRLAVETIPGEDHLTVAPISFTHGLIRALGLRADRTP